MRRPSVEFLPREWARIARAVAGRLRAAGRRAWIVGGALRDLALELVPGDVDMASAAPPEEVERLFESSHAVGKAFGTVVVHLEGRDVQLTTFRTEQGYSDRRRPDRVAWGRSVEEDAARRDFTCNALYLDPLDDTLQDPVGGLADLAAGVLRCVGDPAQRFREDGIRLVRMARFAAAFDLAVDPAALEAARREGAALQGVSGERVAQELRRIFAGPRSARALRLLDELGLLDILFADLGQLAAARDLRWRALEALEPAPGFEEGLSVLFDPGPGAAVAASAARERAQGLLDGLRLSRDENREVQDLWRLQAEARAALAEAPPSRARRIKLVREVLWTRAARVLRSWQIIVGESTEKLDELLALGTGLSPQELRPAPLLTSSDLAAALVPRGPLWGELLREAETLQLEGALDSRAGALHWLAAQVGGNTLRNAKESG